MKKEAILTDDIMCELWDKINSSYGRELFRCSHHDFARAIEQAVLQSEQVQAWKRDADLFRKMASYVYEIKRTHAQDEGNRVRRLQIDIRNNTPSPTQWLADAVDDFDAAMEQQT